MFIIHFPRGIGCAIRRAKFRRVHAQPIALSAVGIRPAAMARFVHRRFCHGPNHTCVDVRQRNSPPERVRGAGWFTVWADGLRAGAPAVDDLQQIEDIDHAVGVGIALARRCAVVA